jgi:hypothetical protein
VRQHPKRFANAYVLFMVTYVPGSVTEWQNLKKKMFLLKFFFRLELKAEKPS